MKNTGLLFGGKADSGEADSVVAYLDLEEEALVSFL